MRKVNLEKALLRGVKKDRAIKMRVKESEGLLKFGWTENSQTMIQMLN